MAQHTVSALVPAARAIFLVCQDRVQSIALVHEKLYQAAEIRSRSAATRWTWMTRRRASETF
mgnify:CR=1 FL=1